MGSYMGKVSLPEPNVTLENSEGNQKKPGEEEPKKPVEGQKKPGEEEPKKPVEEQKKPVEKEPRKSAEELKKLAHKYDTIIKDADQPSSGYLQDHIHTGIFLNQKKKKYWVDEHGRNCFMLFARELSITWSDTPKYWRWFPLEEPSSDAGIELVSLVKVCWLEIHGRFETSLLTPRTTYEVAFWVKIEDSAYGWEVPVNLSLKGPDGKVLEQKVDLMKETRGQWIKLIVGDFETASSTAGEMELSLFEYKGGRWKGGLVIKGAGIWPKQRTDL